MKLAELFHARGYLLLARHLAQNAQDKWAEGLAARWTMLTAWACFELGGQLTLGRDHRQHPLSPRLWHNLDQEQSSRGVNSIVPTQPPWDSWKLIQDERHRFAHPGPGGGPFSRAVEAELATKDCEAA